MKRNLENGDQLTPGESPKFQLKRGRERKLGVEELSAVVGGATAACCLHCETDGTSTTCRCPP